MSGLELLLLLEVSVHPEQNLGTRIHRRQILRLVQANGFEIVSSEPQPGVISFLQVQTLLIGKHAGVEKILYRPMDQLGGIAFWS